MDYAGHTWLEFTPMQDIIINNMAICTEEGVNMQVWNEAL